jgi:hypothetical protein
MTTPIVIEISRNGNPVGNRDAIGQVTSVTPPLLCLYASPHHAESACPPRFRKDGRDDLAQSVLRPSRRWSGGGR